MSILYLKNYYTIQELPNHLVMTKDHHNICGGQAVTTATPVSGHKAKNNIKVYHTSNCSQFTTQRLWDDNCPPFHLSNKDLKDIQQIVTLTKVANLAK